MIQSRDAPMSFIGKENVTEVRDSELLPPGDQAPVQVGIGMSQILVPFASREFMVCEILLHPS